MFTFTNERITVTAVKTKNKQQKTMNFDQIQTVTTVNNSKNNKQQQQQQQKQWTFQKNYFLQCNAAAAGSCQSNISRLYFLKSYIKKQVNQ